MELPEDNLPDDSWAEDESQNVGFVPDAGEIECSRNQWNVEVVQGQVPDAANRISRAVELLLSAAARSSG